MKSIDVHIASSVRFTYPYVLLCFVIFQTWETPLLAHKDSIPDSELFFEYDIPETDPTSSPYFNMHQWDSINASQSELFQCHWQPNELFSYTFPEKVSFTDSVLIQLTDALRCFVIPHDGEVSSSFGWRNNRPHKGVDIRLTKGDPVRAAFNGVVRYAMYNKGGYGHLVIIRHFNGLETYYSHLDKIKVKVNQVVNAGEWIGTGGNSGAQWTGCHLHFEVRYLDNPFDPELMINFERNALHSDSLLLTHQDFLMTKTSRGELLNKPISMSQTPYSTLYTVKKGDTLSLIASKNGTSVSKLCSLNQLKPTSVLQIGQKLKLR